MPSSGSIDPKREPTLKKRIAGWLFMSAVVLASFAQSNASTDGKIRSFVYTNNKSTQWAWVTAYGNPESVGGKVAVGITHTLNDATLGIAGVSSTTIQGAWCVNPGVMDKHELTAVVLTVRIEIKGNQCSASTKDVLDKSVTFMGQDPANKPTSEAKPGITTVTGGGTKMIGTPPENVPGGNVQSDGQGPGGPSYYVEKIPFAIAASLGSSQ
jgi:hypothetical protein